MSIDADELIKDIKVIRDVTVETMHKQPYEDKWRQGCIQGLELAMRMIDDRRRENNKRKE